MRIKIIISALFLLNLLVFYFLPKINFSKDLIINNISYIESNLYQGDVIDNFSRVFLKIQKENIKNITCGLNNCEFKFLSDINKIQFKSEDPRAIVNKNIGSADFKFKKKIFILIIIFEFIILFLFIVRNKIIFFSKKIKNDINFDINESIKNLSNYKYLLYAFIAYNIFIILNINFNNIIVWDEAVYLNTGRDFVEKLELWPYARGPLIQIFYSIIYFTISVIGYDQNWLLSLSITGRLICFIFTLFILVATANRIGYFLDSKYYKPSIYIIVIIIFFPVANLVNPSYSIYTLIFSYAFYFLILAIQTNEKIYYLILSIILGLMGLVRPDALIIIPLLTVSIYFTSRYKLKYIEIFLLLCPALFIIYGYQLFLYFTTGIYETGSMRKLYLAFESAESLNLSNSYSSFLDWYNGAKNLAELKYGSASSNNNNIFVAIFNNPLAFVEREILTLKMLPGAIAEGYTFFNVSSSYIVLYSFILSLIILLKNYKDLFYPIIAILSHLSLYFITLIYSSYLLLDFPIFCLLITIFLSYIMGKGIYNKISLLILLFITLYFKITLLLVIFLIVLLFTNFQTNDSIGFKFKYNSINRFVGINFIFYALIMTILISNYKISPIKISDVSGYYDIYLAKDIVKEKCNDGYLISQTYSFPIFSKISYLPIDKNLINNFADTNFLKNQKLVSCIFVDKIMREQNPLNINNEINYLIANNYVYELFSSNNIKLYRLK